MRKSQINDLVVLPLSLEFRPVYTFEFFSERNKKIVLKILLNNVKLNDAGLI